LLLIAIGGLLVDKIPTQNEQSLALQNAVVLDAGGLLAIEGLPPEQRRMFPQGRDFQKPLSPHPLQDATPRGSSPTPSPAVAVPTSLSRGGTPMATVVDLGANLPRSQQNERRASQAPVSRVYRVREGDVLSRIASRELGDQKAWRQIAALNGITDEGRSLQVGDALVLPPKPGEQTTVESSTASPPTPAVVPTPVPSLTNPPSTYTVVSGDTPDRISKKVYGDRKYWRSLLAANGIDDPGSLQLGAVLKVPKLR